MCECTVFRLAEARMRMASCLAAFAEHRRLAATPATSSSPATPVIPSRARPRTNPTPLANRPVPTAPVTTHAAPNVAHVPSRTFTARRYFLWSLERPSTSERRNASSSPIFCRRNCWAGCGGGPPERESSEGGFASGKAPCCAYPASSGYIWGLYFFYQKDYSTKSEPIARIFTPALDSNGSAAPCMMRLILKSKYPGMSFFSAIINSVSAAKICMRAFSSHCPHTLNLQNPLPTVTLLRSPARELKEGGRSTNFPKWRATTSCQLVCPGEFARHQCRCHTSRGRHTLL
jgi:hypothetical protein